MLYATLNKKVYGTNTYYCYKDIESCLEDISADEILSGTLKYIYMYKKGRTYKLCTVHWKDIQERSFL